MPRPTKDTDATASTTRAAPKSASGIDRSKKKAQTANSSSARAMPYSSAKAPIPNRCTERDRGAMNVYSIVPSQRSQATVSVMISKITPR